MHTPTKYLLSAALVSTIALTAGCSSDMTGAGRSATSDRIDSVEAQINEDGSRLSRIQDTGRPANVNVRQGIFIGKDGFRTGHGDPLPRRLEGPEGVVMKLGDEVTLREFAPLLQRSTGLRVDIRDLDALGGGSDDFSGSNGAGADSTGSDTSGSAGPSSGKSEDPRFRVSYTGSLSGLLDYVANQAGADWEYTGGRIKFLGPQTVTYTIWSLPGTVNASGSVGGGQSATFGTGTPPNTSYEMAYDYWEDIENGLGAIVPEMDARFSVNRSSGTITLTGFRAVHERVQKFIETENARLSRQVSVKIDVLAFTSNDSDRRGASLDAVLEKVSSGLSFDLTNPAGAIVGGSDFGITILDKDSGPLEHLTGSSAIISALAQNGRVSLLNSTSIVASNNQPTPVSIVSEKGYIAGLTTTEEDGVVTSEIQTGILNDGLNMTLTPRIMSSGDVMMSYHMTLTELVGLEQVNAGNSMVQLPETQNRSFMQTVTIDSGDAMVVAAHDSNRAKREAFGPFNPAFWGLGGQDAYSDDNTKIVILMTPVVVEGANKPRARR